MWPALSSRLRHAAVPGALRLIAAVLVVLAFAAGPAVAKPALWVVRSPTATIYLFGTVHALNPDMKWHSSKLDHAFAQAKELWLEIGDGGFYRQSAPLVQRFGTDYRKPLSSKLPKADLDQIDAALRKAGVQDGRARIEWLRPWVVAMMLGGGASQGLGLERGSGADLSLQEDAAEADKPVRALETMEQQLRVFADMPPPLEIAVLEDALAHLDSSPDKMSALLTAWMAGDVDTIAKFTITRDGPTEDEVYRRLLVNRNKTWATKIAELLKGSGTILIAAGAAHFAGPDSVQMQLEALGIKTERVQ
jgi:uncharacterized protein YbaP (TraB family)